MLLRFLFLALSLALPSYGQILSPISFSSNALSTCGGSKALVAVSTSGIAGGNTGAINSTGATLLIMVVGDGSASANTVVDSKGNTWHALTSQSKFGNTSQIFYSYDHAGSALSVGSGHTASLTTSSLPAYFFYAFSGTSTTAPFIVENGAVTAVFGATIQPGSVTPTCPNNLLITGVGPGGDNIGPFTVNSGFTASTRIGGAGTNYAVGAAYLTQSAATAQNPTWTIETGGFYASAIAVFQ